MRHDCHQSKPTPACGLKRIVALHKAALPWLVAQAGEMVRIGAGQDVDFSFWQCGKSISTVR
jgi:hypothetical protein